MNEQMVVVETVDATVVEPWIPRISTFSTCQTRVRRVRPDAGVLVRAITDVHYLSLFVPPVTTSVFFVHLWCCPNALRAMATSKELHIDEP